MPEILILQQMRKIAPNSPEAVVSVPSSTHTDTVIYTCCNLDFTELNELL